MKTTRTCLAETQPLGFSLTELLVVLGTVALLAATLLPALAGTRSDGRAFRCLNNLKQLALAWNMYANDNGDRLMSPPGWINSSSLLDWTIAPANSNVDLMLNGALIAPYVKTPSSFKCPADTFAGPAGPRVRTYSLDGALGGAPVFGRTYPSNNPRTYFSAVKLTDLNTPGPANIFAFLDEHPDSINDGQFMLNAGSTDENNCKWRDFPGSLHAGCVSVSFTDGHAQMHQWMEARTCQQVEFKYFATAKSPQTTPINQGINLLNSPDYLWLEDRMPYHY